MTIKRYSAGFLLCLALTLVAYALVMGSPNTLQLLFALGVLAVVQLAVQLEFFLHLGDEVRPRMKIASFFFMASLLIILIAGSMWIMRDLNLRMMQLTPEQKTEYMTTQYNRGF